MTDILGPKNLDDPIAQHVRRDYTPLNVDLTVDELQGFCRLDRPSRRLLAQARASLALSARGVHRVLRVARTVADLDTTGSSSSSHLALTHLAEAVQLRLADRV